MWRRKWKGGRLETGGHLCGVTVVKVRKDRDKRRPGREDCEQECFVDTHS